MASDFSLALSLSSSFFSIKSINHDSKFRSLYSKRVSWWKFHWRTDPILFWTSWTFSSKRSSKCFLPFKSEIILALICWFQNICHFLQISSCIWLFLEVESAKCATELGKIIKYSKNWKKMKKILQFLLLYLWPLLEPKMFIVQCSVYIRKKSW